MNVKLIGKFLPVAASVFVDAINRANADASGIQTVYAETSYGPGHCFVFFLLDAPARNPDEIGYLSPGQ
jgi:hypothetical protein